ncbi:hypothetical protein JW998_02865 [candidate division KSB1 bacterium]|nr:hypothetical protein [candidate division KSB1 bacterium]
MIKALFLHSLLFAAAVLADGLFYRQYWAEFDENISNHRDGRWRVNDPEIATDDAFGKRSEVLANGLVLLNAPELLVDLEKAVLYLEMWGGHPHTANKRVTVNGKAVYSIPDYGTALGHCVYAYPSVDIEPPHLVTGVNALQFSCERGEGFWGHFILDNVALQCVYKPDSVRKRHPGLVDFFARVVAPPCIENDTVTLRLDIPQDSAPKIGSVEFIARYTGFDENGNCDHSDWHGYTFKRERISHVGNAVAFPFAIKWDVRLLPDQSTPLQFKAIVKFKDGLCYETAPTTGSLLRRSRESVQMFYCADAPVPFWSRAGVCKTAKIYSPIDPEKIVAAQLHIKIWDGGEGNVTKPFRINGHAYPVTSKRAIHDVVHSVLTIDPAHLVKGDNVIALLSDTDHHGIEILRPGPCLIIRQRQ